MLLLQICSFVSNDHLLRVPSSCPLYKTVFSPSSEIANAVTFFFLSPHFDTTTASSSSPKHVGSFGKGMLGPRSESYSGRTSSAVILVPSTPNSLQQRKDLKSYFQVRRTCFGSHSLEPSPFPLPTITRRVPFLYLNHRNFPLFIIANVFGNTFSNPKLDLPFPSLSNRKSSRFAPNPVSSSMLSLIRTYSASSFAPTIQREIQS
mmetsp:Transcript_27959/g.47503  ORF Transcript_27959/g.47503 Transcript_27959/m.47503 type:complete len:205 (+) Transcript_27959:1378-1992(+)